MDFIEDPKLLDVLFDSDCIVWSFGCMKRNRHKRIKNRSPSALTRLSNRSCLALDIMKDSSFKNFKNV